MSSLESGDRRRLLLAGVTTIAVVPFLLGGGGNAASTGVAAIGESASIAGALDSSAGASEPAAHSPALDVPSMPGFLIGPPPATDPAEVTIVVPTSGPANLLEGRATYERFTDEPGASDPCAFPGVEFGTDLLVLDLDNGKSVWCTAIGPPGPSARADLVLDTEEFEQIADLGQSPVHVRITW
ncbi:MAG TPA: hypothetical protein VID93_03510 [Acidimicrobiales bacterium]